MRWKLIILFFTLNLFNFIRAQQISKIPQENDSIIKHCQFKAPEFPGGLDSLKQIIINQYNLPNYQDTKKLLIKFAINEEGKAVNIEIENNLSDESDCLLIKILNEMPLWTICKGRPLYHIVLPLTIVAKDKYEIKK